MLEDDGKFSIKSKGSILRLGVHVPKCPKSLEETYTTRLVN